MLLIDSKFYKVTVYIYRLLILNLLLIVFSLPLVTIGASLCAFFKVLQDDKPSGYIKDFVVAFRHSFLKSLLPLGFTFLCLVFAISLYLSGVNNFGLFWFMRMIFISFLVCFNLNVYLLQSRQLTGHAFALLRESFIFTAMTFMRTVLYPLGITVAAWLAAKYLGEFIVVIILAVVLSAYLPLVRKPLQQFTTMKNPFYDADI